MLVLVDGFICGAAALVAARLTPAFLDYAVFCHASAEAGHRTQLQALAVEPLVSLDLRLGEGTGAALAWPLARALPAATTAPQRPLALRPFLIAAVLPALVVPLILAPFDIRVLPVLVADYLALHFAAFGAITLAVLSRTGRLRGQFPLRVWPMAALVGLAALLAFGLALDRYVASFLPHPGRIAVIAGLALGAIPYFLGDALLTEAGRAPLWRVLLVRGAFLMSLVAAVALNFDRLMFLLIILPVIVLFYLLFGTMAGWVGRRTGYAAIGGLGFGLMLAWSLGVTFPMFA
jgi:hypothetical protein